MSSILRLIITADNKLAIKSIDETAVASERASKGIIAGDEKVQVANDETAFSFERMRSGVGLLAGAVGLGALAFGIKDVVTAGEKWQANQAALQHALKNTGQFTQSTLKQINAGAESLATHGGFGVEEQVTALSQLVAATGSATKAQQLNVAATNIARGAHISYQAAIKGVEGAMAGQGRAIQKLIGVIVPVTQYTYGWTAAMKAADPVGYQHAVTLNKLATAQEIVGRVQQKYAGQTKAFSHTVAGAFSNIKNAVDILVIRLGVALLPIVAKIAQALLHVVQWVSSNWPKIKGVILAAFSPITTVIRWLGGMNTVLIGLGAGLAVFAAYKGVLLGVAGAQKIAAAAMAAWNAITVVTTGLTYGLGAATTALGVAFDFVAANPIVLALAALVVVIALVATHFSAFKKIVGDVFKTLSSAVSTAVDWVVGKFDAMVSFFTRLPGRIAAIAVHMWDWLKHGLISVLNWIIGKFNGLIGLLNDGINAYNAVGGWLTGNIGTIGKIGLVPNGASQSAARSAALRGIGPNTNPQSGINSGPNTSVTVTGHRAPAQDAAPIVLHHTTTLNGRVLAEEVVHYAQKRQALS